MTAATDEIKLAVATVTRGPGARPAGRTSARANPNAWPDSGRRPPVDCRLPSRQGTVLRETSWMIVAGGSWSNDPRTGADLVIRVPFLAQIR